MNRLLSWNELRTESVRLVTITSSHSSVLASEMVLDFVNAGHPPGILSTRKNAAPLLKATGSIISPALNLSWEQHTVKVKRKSDRIVLFTDAVIEAESNSRQFGLDRLVEEVSKRPIHGNALSEQILHSVRQFAGGRPSKDDLTLVIADL